MSPSCPICWISALISAVFIATPARADDYVAVSNLNVDRPYYSEPILQYWMLYQSFTTGSNAAEANDIDRFTLKMLTFPLENTDSITLTAHVYTYDPSASGSAHIGASALWTGTTVITPVSFTFPVSFSVTGLNLDANSTYCFTLDRPSTSVNHVEWNEIDSQTTTGAWTLGTLTTLITDEGGEVYADSSDRMQMEIGTSVPEASTFAALAGIGAFAFALVVRPRRKRD